MLFFYQQSIATLSALILLTAFFLLIIKSPKRLVSVYAWQSFLLAVSTFLGAWSGGKLELYFSAFLILILKVIVIPCFLYYLMRNLKINQLRQTNTRYNVLLLIGAAALVLFCYYVVMPITLFASLATKNTMVVAMSVVLLGMLIMIVKRDALTHVLGFMEMENGLFFAALVATQGMPMVVELGVAFDILVAAVLFGVLFFHIRSSIDSLDVDRLNRLREDVE